MERAELFPEKFAFFGYGNVERIREPKASQKAEPKNKPARPGRKAEPLLRNIAATVLLQLSGDERGVCAVIFESLPFIPAVSSSRQSLDERASMAVEIANILVSKFANLVSDRTDGLVAVSPPELVALEDARHRNLLMTVRNIVAGKSAEIEKTGKLARHKRPEPLVRRYEYKNGECAARLCFVYLRAAEGRC
ncbi:MAG: hypothetical protein HYW49_01805 [Deltaproteobacteria bacterium]|nr:hypothetical protein [Deltaproteobacteria bacterium]